jgi:hypothetical protein
VRAAPRGKQHSTAHISSSPSMASLSVPPVPTDPRRDAIDLHRAFKGFGCDATAVTAILAHRDASQRALIRRHYAAVYHQDLLHRLAAELSGHHKRAVLLWVLDPASRDAAVLHQALNGDVTDMRAATEVVCSRTPSQLLVVRQAYLARFGGGGGGGLEHDVAVRASGDHQRLLLAYLRSPRYEGPEVVDMAAAARDARELYRAGERRLGTDERTFIRVFSERSAAHMAAVAAAYHHMYDRSLEKVIYRSCTAAYALALVFSLSEFNGGRVRAHIHHYTRIHLTHGASYKTRMCTHTTTQRLRNAEGSSGQLHKMVGWLDSKPHSYLFDIRSFLNIRVFLLHKNSYDARRITYTVLIYEYVPLT